MILITSMKPPRKDIYFEIFSYYLFEVTTYLLDFIPKVKYTFASD